MCMKNDCWSANAECGHHFSIGLPIIYIPAPFSLGEQSEEGLGLTLYKCY